MKKNKMSVAQFFSQLSILAILTGLGLYFIEQNDYYSIHISLSWMLWILLNFMSVLFFVLSKISKKSKNINMFSYVFLGGTLHKFIISATFVLIYITWYYPGNIYFIYPFLTLYILYTIFEVYFLSILSQER